MESQVQNQFPLIGGKAVYKARAYYLLIDREADFDDLSLCLSNSYKKEKEVVAEQSNPAPFFKLQPNPSSEGTYLFYQLSGAAELQLYSPDGRVLQQQTLSNEGSIVYVSTTTLPNGIYLLRLTQNSENVYQTKLVVKH